MTKIRLGSALLVVQCFGAWIAPISAQVNYNSVGETLVETFDALPTGEADTPWADNATLPGWYAAYDSDKIEVIAASTGGTNEGRLYSYGANGASDRAFGSLASGSTGTIDRGIRLINGTGMTLTQFMLQYDGEQWRMGTNNDAINSLAVAYRFFAPATGSLDAAGYLDLPWAAFDSPRVNTDPGSAFSLDGNAPINREAEITAWVGPIDWMPDDELWIRFRDLNDGGFDHGLGVDDFRFEAVPEPSTIGLLAVGVLWLGVWRFRRRGARSVG